MAKKTYTNYAHYIGLIPQRALMGIVVAIIVGLVIDVIPRLDNSNYSPKYTEIEGYITGGLRQLQDSGHGC